VAQRPQCSGPVALVCEWATTTLRLGEPAEVFELLQRCVAEAERFGPRVSAVIKLDHRPGRTDMLHGKVARVDALLAEGDSR
jgi:uncharacterized protein YqgV (UPF0045/DUF77 family)